MEKKKESSCETVHAFLDDEESQEELSAVFAAIEAARVGLIKFKIDMDEAYNKGDHVGSGKNEWMRHLIDLKKDMSDIIDLLKSIVGELRIDMNVQYNLTRMSCQEKLGEERASETYKNLVESTKDLNPLLEDVPAKEGETEDTKQSSGLPEVGWK